MQPVSRFLLQTAVIVLVAIGLSALFNAHSPRGLSWLKVDSRTTVQTSSGEILLAEARALVEAGQAIFVDARDEFSYAEGHIQDALSLPEENFDYEFSGLESQLAGKLAITYCDGEHCRLSHDLAQKLREKGVTARILVNGWSLWLEAGLPVAPTE